MRRVLHDVTLGTHRTPQEYLYALSVAGHMVDGQTKRFAQRVSCSSAKSERTVAIMSVMDLGFEVKTRYDAVLARIAELGYELSSGEAALAFRLAYPEQGHHEPVVVLMEGMHDGREGASYIFVAMEDGGYTKLGLCRAESDSMVPPEVLLMFLLPSETVIL